jgi:hypothetical protein
MPVVAAEIAAAVTEREFRRLLALPRRGSLPEGVLESMRAARRWYSAYGDPFVATHRVDVEEIGPSRVTLATGDVIGGDTLAEYLVAGDVHGIVVVAASAGTKVADEAARLWRDDRPDAGYALDRFAAAVAESLLLLASASLCESLSPRREQLLRHLSPGCGRWDIAHQRDLMRVLTGSSSSPAREEAVVTLGPVTLLESGGLSPQHSVLAAFGVTHRAHAATPEAACRDCDLDPCNLRRVPFARRNPGPRVTP